MRIGGVKAPAQAKCCASDAKAFLRVELAEAEAEFKAAQAALAALPEEGVPPKTAA